MSDKLVNIITCDNMKADAVLLANGKITAMEFSQMHKKIEKLEASINEILGGAGVLLLPHNSWR